MPLESLLPLQWEVPQIFRDRLGRAAGRQRAPAWDPGDPQGQLRYVRYADHGGIQGVGGVDAA